MSGMTQLAGADALKGTANGKAPSAVTGTEFGSDGLVYATYADGTRRREVIGIQHDPSGKPNPAYTKVVNLPDGVLRSLLGCSGAGDDMDEIEEILRRHGIQ